MKEYEKLADEYINDRSEEGARCREAFVQGFLKARDMAFKTFYEQEGGGTWEDLAGLGEKEV